MSIKNFLGDLLFPKLCLNCQREGNYLCEDCFSLIADTMYHLPASSASPSSAIDFLPAHSGLPYSPYGSGNLKGVFSAVPYNDFIIKKLMAQFKYEPFVKDLAKTLTSLIIHQLQSIERQTSFWQDAVLIPIPLAPKRLKERGYNQAELLGKELSEFLKIPLVNNSLLKIKETPPQAELSKKEREENVKGVFLVKNKDPIKGRKILLVDDVFTTGSTMAEAARILKSSGAKEVWGITVAVDEA